MKYHKFLCLLFLLFVAIDAFSQSDVEMADNMRQEGKIYVVVAALVIILSGLILLLIKIDRKVFEIEKKIGREVRQ